MEPVYDVRPAEKPLWASLQRDTEIAVRGVSEADWNFLKSDGHVQDWLRASPSDRASRRERCVACLRHLRKRDAAQLAEVQPQNRKEGRSEDRWAGTRAERIHAAMRARTLAQEATRFAQPFRNDYLGGRILKADEARALLDSRLARLFQHRHFAAEGIPIVGHRVLGTDVVSGRGRAQRVRLTIGRESPRRPARILLEGAPYFSTADTPTVEIPGPTLFREPKRVAALRGSVLHDLGTVAELLSAKYLWTEAAAAWFVLTGEYPYTRPVDARVRLGEGRTCAVITLDVLPFVEPETVAKLYEFMRSRRWPAARIPSKRRVLMLAFVEKATAAAGGMRPLWKTLCSDFNRSVAGSLRYPSWKNMARDWSIETGGRAGDGRAAATSKRRPDAGAATRPRKSGRRG